MGMIVPMDSELYQRNWLQHLLRCNKRGKSRNIQF